ncbi:hypothetical protein FRC07_008402, partial [Ceratobasidium sp. 392]
MDDNFLKDPADRMRAQIMLQQLYYIEKSRQQRNPSSLKNSSENQEEVKVTQEPETATNEKKPDEPGPICDAEEVFKKLRSEEDVDISTWRTKHMQLFEHHPKQHQNCHRTVWRIVDVLEQRDQNSGEIIPLMRDVYRLSERHAFNHSNAGHKLAELLVSRSGFSFADLMEAVSIRRNLLDLEDVGAEAGHLSRLADVLAILFQKTSDLGVLKEQISLIRQLLFLNP